MAAFVAAAILYAYRARLQSRAEIIANAPVQARLEAIAATAEFFRVDVSGLPPKAQTKIVLAQIYQRTRRDLILSVTLIVISTILAIVALLPVTKPVEVAVTTPVETDITSEKRSELAAACNDEPVSPMASEIVREYAEFLEKHRDGLHYLWQGGTAALGLAPADGAQILDVVANREKLIIHHGW